MVLVEDADRLSARALDALHHRLERHPAGVTFILTSARPEALHERVQDLLLPLPVRPLGRDERAELIARVCAREGIAAETPAVDRLAALAGGRPRRLLRDLETLTADDRITVEAIDAFYDRSVVGPAALYVARILERRPFLEQLEPLDKWEAEPAEKIAGVAAAFAALFAAYLGVDAQDGRGAVFPQAAFLQGVDGSASTRAALDKRARTLGLTPRALFAAILEFWRPLPSADAGQLLARTSAFDEHLNGPGGRARTEKGLELPVRHRRRAPAVRAHEAVGGGPRRSGGIDRLRPTQVRAIWEAGSFLIQRHGVCLNARISLRHADLACAPEAIGPFVSSLLHELGMRVADRTQAAGSPSVLHYIYVHETGSLGGRTHVAAHVPPGTGALRPWLARRFADARTGIRLRHWPATGGSEPYRRHLRLMALLCRSCDPEISSPGRAWPSRLVADLGVSPRMRGPIGRSPCTQRCGASRLIGPGAPRGSSWPSPPFRLRRWVRGRACERLGI
ncbi:hypothetical protein ASG60_18280 [Methylobacterium sp. Leaf469]|nr:hypothetical protein ASG60_18280 [Methylobacterium sp. Leaf469]